MSTIARSILLVVCLLVFILPNSASTASVPCASSITPGTTMTCTIAVPSEVDTVTFTALLGDVVLVRVGVSAGEMHPLVRIFEPDGSKTCENYTWGTGAEIKRCALLQDGEHKITISDFDSGNKTGTYNLYYQKLTDPAFDGTVFPGTVVASTIQAAAEADTYAWNAGNEDVIQVRMVRTTGTLYPLVRVYDSYGVMLCEKSTYGSMAEIEACFLPSKGRYAIVATDSYNANRTGMYNLSVTCLVSNCGDFERVYLPLVTK